MQALGARLKRRKRLCRGKNWGMGHTHSVGARQVVRDRRAAFVTMIQEDGEVPQREDEREFHVRRVLGGRSGNGAVGKERRRLV